MRTICVAKMLDNTQSIICAFCLAAGTPRSPYRHVELCGIALKIPICDSRKGGTHWRKPLPLTSWPLVCRAARHCAPRWTSWRPVSPQWAAPGRAHRRFCSSCKAACAPPPPSPAKRCARWQNLTNSTVSPRPKPPSRPPKPAPCGPAAKKHPAAKQKRKRTPPSGSRRWTRCAAHGPPSGSICSGITPPPSPRGGRHGSRSRPRR